MQLETYLWILIPLLCLTVFFLGAVGVTKLQALGKRRIFQESMSPEILSQGLLTTATVLKTKDTGARIDRIFILTKLHLQVAAIGQIPAFEVEIVVPISPVKLVDFAEGRQIQVKVDTSTLKVAIYQAVE